MLDISDHQFILRPIVHRQPGRCIWTIPLTTNQGIYSAGDGAWRAYGLLIHVSHCHCAVDQNSGPCQRTTYIIFRATVKHYTSCSKPFYHGHSDLLLTVLNIINVELSITATLAIPSIVGYLSEYEALIVSSTNQQPSVIYWLFCHYPFKRIHSHDPGMAMTGSYGSLSNSSKPLTMNHYIPTKHRN